MAVVAPPVRCRDWCLLSQELGAFQLGLLVSVVKYPASWRLPKIKMWANGHLRDKPAVTNCEAGILVLNPDMFGETDENFKWC